jgi:endoribonuclease Dicer
MPQLCSIQPIPASLWQELLYLPSILYRLEGVLVAEELRQTFSLNTGVGSVEWPGDTDIPLIAAGESVGENCAERNVMVNNLQQCEMKGIEETKNEPGPSSTLFLRALTCVGTCDVFSHERLEMYGDALIKHTVSLNLYCEPPFSNIGEISFLRGLRVSNRQLFYLGRALNLPSYIYNLTFKPLVNWYPHGFTMLPSVKTQGRYLGLNALGQEIDLSNIEDEKTENDEEACERSALSVLVDSQSHVVASDKTIADTTEAIIGAYLVTCGFKDTLRVMKWMGLDVRDKNDQDNGSPETLTDSLSEHVVDQETPDIDDGFFENSLHHKECLYSEFKDVEELLGYSFRNKLLLLQAFTHASYPRDFNRVRTSYENLEFIGDALLDYLVTRYLFCTHRTMSPGALTDLRSAVVNSYSFAFLAFKYGFHKHLRSLSPVAFRIVNTFVVIQDDMITKKMRENPDQVCYSPVIMLITQLSNYMYI